VFKAAITNLLEDEKETVKFHTCAATEGVTGLSDTVLDLAFRGFQVVTLKLKVEMAPEWCISPPATFAARTESGIAQTEGWVDVFKM